MSNGTIEDSKQALVKDLKSVIGDAGDLINNVAASGADGLARAKCTVDASDQFVRDHPWKVLGIAAAAGIVIGAILSRR